MNLKDFAVPFPSQDIEWRIGRSGEKGEGDKKQLWATCLAYVTNRAIMSRLDEVCGPENWRNEYLPGPIGGVMCGISIKVGGEWVTKWDGAEGTDIETIKGGFSDAMKRAAVQWGIGRYLYNLDEGKARIHSNGRFYASKGKNTPAFKWDPPPLPAWALPGGPAIPPPQQEPTETPPQQEGEEPKTVADRIRGLLTTLCGENKDAKKKLVAEMTGGDGNPFTLKESDQETLAYLLDKRVAEKCASGT